MDLGLLFRGLIMGFSIAAPVGPIGVLCIRRTLAEGRTSGFVSGLGAATADGIYGCIAGFGLTFVSRVLVDQQGWLHVVGGAFLCYLGIKTLLASPAERPASVGGTGLVGAYASTFLLTLANPMTILLFVAVFAGLGIGDAGGDYTSALVLVLGVFTGSAAWWFLLSGGVGLFRARFTPQALQWINRLSGLVVIGFGIFALWSVVAGWL